MSWDNNRYWPTAYRPKETWTHARRTLEEAGIEPFEERAERGAAWFAWGFCIGIMIGMGLIDMMGSLT